MTPESPVLTVKDAAQLAQMSTATMNRWLNGELTGTPKLTCAVKVGGRWKVNRDFTVDIESTMDRETVAGLVALGHKLKSIDDPYMDFGSGQYIWRLDRNDPERGYVAASDTRRDGLAAGY